MVTSGTQQLRDVVLECGIAPFVRSNAVAVDPHLGDIVDGVELHARDPARADLRHIEVTLIDGVPDIPLVSLLNGPAVRHYDRLPISLERHPKGPSRPAQVDSRFRV